MPVPGKGLHRRRALSVRRVVLLVPRCEPEARYLPRLGAGRPTVYAKVMRSAIAPNGSFFNAQRMVDQYVQNAYPAAVES